ncbi:hypothetical protein GOP47_0006686 [Adiantum capillus-veneris]|uniref:Peroxisomal membrane protein 11B n=1 Tax=Adiantum capillus-veneris TaxID=13818 RepID=A0A9D4ZN96_ADICA|nr:hypothetical protein GOP47_0006686 [Adiantum capillus-veneris]
MVGRQQDAVDRLVTFLAKRDGIDKLVKTFQYVAKLAHWRLQAVGRSSLADRAKKWEVSCGTSRKAFRTGRFLAGLNALRSPYPNLCLQLLAILSNGGEVVYFFFDHLLWFARIGLLDPHLAPRMSFISAFGEGFGYIFFIIADLIVIRKGLGAEKQLRGELESAIAKEEEGGTDQIKAIMAKIRGIRVQRIMQFMAISANLADLVIALAEVEPNPFFNHAFTLGISGLVSAWAGWYRNWPSST